MSRAALAVLWCPALASGCGTGTGRESPFGTHTTPEPPACEAPLLAPGLGGDASLDATAEGAWFRSVMVPGVTDVKGATSGAAWVDLDGDHDVDLLRARDAGLELWLNDGCLGLSPWPLQGASGEGMNAPMVADFSGDGLLDVYVPSHGALRAARLLMATGVFNHFVDVAAELGVANPGSYARGGATLGDLDDDGWLDFAIGGFQIGGSVGTGRPLSRLYRYRPGNAGFLTGSYEDLTSTVPGLGLATFAPCRPGAETTGMDLTLADLDDDGRLDLIEASHNDMALTAADDACATGTNPYGLRAWRAGATTDAWTLWPEEAGSLTDVGRMTYDEALGYYVVGEPAVAPETIALFDADNDGDQDLVAVGPSDPDWHVSSGQTTPLAPGHGARFLRRDPGAWVDATEASGLGALNWTLATWGAFFDSPVPDDVSSVMDALCALGSQTPLCEPLAVPDRLPYPSQVLPLDADNDGWVDLLYVVRQCQYGEQPHDDVRSVLFHNQGDGTFAPLTTEQSGVTGCGLAGFAEDVDGDGWVDVHLIARDELATVDAILRNAGAAGAFGHHHWVSVRLAGRPDAQLLGARVVARDGDAIVASGWVSRDAWRGSREPSVHLGLGELDRVTIEVRLRSGELLAVDLDEVDAAVVVEVP